MKRQIYQGRQRHRDIILINNFVMDFIDLPDKCFKNNKITVFKIDVFNLNSTRDGSS